MSTKFFHMSVVEYVNPSGVTCSISGKLYVLLCLATEPFTEAHVNSIGLSSQWATGNLKTVCPCVFLMLKNSTHMYTHGFHFKEYHPPQAFNL